MHAKKAPQVQCAAGFGLVHLVDGLNYVNRLVTATKFGMMIPNDQYLFNSDPSGIPTRTKIKQLTFQYNKRQVGRSKAISIDTINFTGNAAGGPESSSNKKNLDINDRVRIHQLVLCMSVCSTLAVA